MKKVEIDKIGYLRRQTDSSYLCCPQKIILPNDTTSPTYCCHKSCAWFDTDTNDPEKLSDKKTWAMCHGIEIGELVDTTVTELSFSLDDAVNELKQEFARQCRILNVAITEVSIGCAFLRYMVSLYGGEPNYYLDTHSGVWSMLRCKEALAMLKVNGLPLMHIAIKRKDSNE